MTMISTHEATLPNGLRVVVIPQPALHRAAITLFVGVGSRYEDAANNGISHFLEHMLYRGTARHPSAHLQNLAFEELGGTLYAATTADHTSIGINVPPSSTASVLELLGEVIRAPRFGELDLERRIVREEISEDLDEDGRQIEPDNVARAVAFGDHPLGFPITGLADSLERFDEKLLRAHLGRYYVASNAVLAIAGACDEQQSLELARRHLGALPAAARPLPVPFDSAQKRPRRKHVASPGSQTDLRLSFVTPGEKHPQANAIELLLRVLDDGMSTRLYHRLCDAGGLVYDCHASWEPFSDCGVLDLAAEVQHARLGEVIESCLEMARGLASEGPTEAEIKKARDRQHWGIEASLDDPDDLVSLIGGAVFFDRPRPLEEQAARLDGLSPSDVAAAAREVFRADRMQLVTVGTLTASAREQARASIKTHAEFF